jgi:aryl-alcohol dehydrogenase-like predicted oxidoreductase
MELRVLGRTGLEVSVAGLGCGGPSRLGQTQGASEAESVRVVERALDLGINYLDTAEAYGTEDIVGKAIAGRRESVFVSTKTLVTGQSGHDVGAKELRTRLVGSLRRLGCDYVDVFHLHGVRESEYDRCVSELVPELARLRDDGLVRFLGISEHFNSDRDHRMLRRALTDDYWDVMMVGFNLLNPSARRYVFPISLEKNIGIEIMFAVRRALSNPEKLRGLIEELVDQGYVESEIDLNDPLGFLVRDGAAESVVDAAYRFARHEPGADIVLTGTGNLEHLEENVESLLRGPLPQSSLDRLGRLFAPLEHLTGD